LACFFSGLPRNFRRYSRQLRISPRLLPGSANLLELLPDVLRNDAQPFGVLAIYLAGNALQLGGYALRLCGLPLVVGRNSPLLRCLALGLGSLALGFACLVVAHRGRPAYTRADPRDSRPRHLGSEALLIQDTMRI
jgi:hypothetical protein